MRDNKFILPYSSSPNPQTLIPNHQSGFTLIEIAMVLVVIGILLGIGTGMMGVLTKRTKLIDSREVVKAAKEALSGYAVKYGYLPATIAPTGARELDAWGRNLSYAADTTLLLTTTNACNRTNTDRTIFECTNTACTTANQKDNIAFLVYSTGEDAEGTGTTTLPTGGPACPGGKTCYWLREQDSSYTVGPTTYNYDDIVQYVTLDEIRNARSCAFNITTQTLPDAKVGIVYNATGVQLQASGGQTPYTSWLVTTGALPAGITLSSPGGLLSGTPTTAGVYNFTVTLTDANSVTTSKTFTLNVIETLAITNQTLPDARTGAAYSVTLNGIGGTGAYAWSTGQAQGACPLGSVQIVATNIGLCLVTNPGGTTTTLSSSIAASPYPTTPGVYNFTVTLTANAITTSRTFTLNVIDSCAATGINVYGALSNRSFKRNLSGACNTGVGSGCANWIINTNLGAANGGSGGIQPNDTYCFYAAVNCATLCTGNAAAANYSSAQTIDVNENCQIKFSTTGCANNLIDN